MVTKRNLLDRIKKLEERLLFTNKRIDNLFIKVEKENQKEEQDKIEDWLTDDRVDEVQSFLHKGVK